MDLNSRNLDLRSEVKDLKDEIDDKKYAIDMYKRVLASLNLSDKAIRCLSEEPEVR